MKKTIFLLFTFSCALSAANLPDLAREGNTVALPSLVEEGQGVGAVSSQDKTIAELFKAAPDSLFPYLSTNNRLDMIDFMEANMKAEVTNLLDGKSEMTALTSDSLSIRMNDVLRIDMKVEQVAEPVDSSLQVIRVVRTYTLNEKQTERLVDVYSVLWRRISSKVSFSSLLKRDEELHTFPL